MTPPPTPADRGLTRPLPPLAATAAWTFVAVLVAALLRLWHGSWILVGQALLAPLIFTPFVLGLWVFEQVRQRPVPAWLALLGGIGGGAFAGLASSIFLPALGPVRGNVIGGIVWGTIIALGWARRGRR
ncbi:MAG: hypothetical protein ACYC3F_17170 [Gemmatimonadaceae bacterium]